MSQKFSAYLRIVYDANTKEPCAVRWYGDDEKPKGKVQLLDQERLPIFLFQLVDADYNVFKESPHVIFAISKPFQEKLMANRKGEFIATLQGG